MQEGGAGGDVEAVSACGELRELAHRCGQHMRARGAVTLTQKTPLRDPQMRIMPSRTHRSHGRTSRLARHHWTKRLPFCRSSFCEGAKNCDTLKMKWVMGSFMSQVPVWKTSEKVSPICVAVSTAAAMLRVSPMASLPTRFTTFIIAWKTLTSACSWQLSHMRHVVKVTRCALMPSMTNMPNVAIISGIRMYDGGEEGAEAPAPGAP